jgi:predicted dehydrogenase
LEGELKGPVRWRFAGEEEQVLEGKALRDAFADAPANPASSFLCAVRDGGVATPSFAEALPAHRLADAIYASAENGGAVVEDPEGAQPAASPIADGTRPL